LRGYDDLPDVISHDVDILVQEKHLKSFEQTLQDVANFQSWYFIRRVRRFGYHSWHLILNLENSFSFLHLDAWTLISWKSIGYVDEDKILGTRRIHNDFWVASAGSEAAISLLKEYLQFGKVKDKGEGRTKKRIAQLVQEDKENFIATLEPYLGKELTQILLEGALNSDWPRLETEVRRVRKCLISRACRSRPFQQFWEGLCFLRWHFMDKVMYPSGVFVCLIGPDGSGKTTISNILQHDMDEVFNLVRYYHGHWGLFPELMTFYNILVRFLNKNPNKKVVQSLEQIQYQSETNVSIAGGLLHIFYYSLEYFFGYIKLLKAKMRGEMVLFDRYFYDYMIQPTYSRVPHKLLWVIEMVLPQPDVLIWLQNEPEVIHARKPELPVSEIRRQVEICEEIVERIPAAVAVTTNADPTVTLQQVRDVVFENMRGKVKWIH